MDSNPKISYYFCVSSVIRENTFYFQPFYQAAAKNSTAIVEAQSTASITADPMIRVKEEPSKPMKVEPVVSVHTDSCASDEPGLSTGTDSITTAPQHRSEEVVSKRWMGWTASR